MVFSAALKIVLTIACREAVVGDAGAATRTSDCTRGDRVTRATGRGRHVAVGLALVVTTASLTAQRPRTYDPLALPDAAAVRTVDLTVSDGVRRRDIPIRVYLPAASAAAPVVIFSHGLGGSREGYAYLGEQWRARGYVAVFLQHPGSDTSVWIDTPPAERMRAMQEAANARNFLLRVRDVPVAIDQLEHWQKTEGHPLRGRMDLARVGMAGHSFGAVTTQAVSGQRVARGGAALTDRRIRAAIAMSPSRPAGGTVQQAFGAVTVPWMVMTGTKDDSPIGGGDPASRLTVFPALPPGDKFELVLDLAEHSAFSDRALPGDTERRNPSHRRTILALSTAFWDAYLRGEADARAWLTGDGPRAVLDPKDRWQKK
jgi:predicted dienelactone hydrolase